MAPKRSRHWNSRHDEGHDLRMTIGDVARAAAAPGWSRLAVHHARVGTHARTTLTRDGREIPADGLDEPFLRLRELSYRAGAGTWFTCELAFSPGSRGHSGRVDSTAPPFADVPAMAALTELTAFPREEPPGWLLAALPTAAPLGLPVTYGERYDRTFGRRAEEKPPPVLPISGELAYRPATAMTARAFGHRQEHRRPALYLAERDGDRQSARLLVTRYEKDWWVERDRRRGATGDGVRSLTLDDAALRLELTPEAADALGTEIAYEVRLDLPAETIGELRTVLAGVLRPVVHGPELIGF